LCRQSLNVMQFFKVDDSAVFTSSFVYWGPTQLEVAVDLSAPDRPRTTAVSVVFRQRRNPAPDGADRSAHG
jgi:hypothetical protein